MQLILVFFRNVRPTCTSEIECTNKNLDDSKFSVDWTPGHCTIVLNVDSTSIQLEIVSSFINAIPDVKIDNLNSLRYLLSGDERTFGIIHLSLGSGFIIRGRLIYDFDINKRKFSVRLKARNPSSKITEISVLVFNDYSRYLADPVLCIPTTRLIFSKANEYMQVGSGKGVKFRLAGIYNFQELATYNDFIKSGNVLMRKNSLDFNIRDVMLTLQRSKRPEVVLDIVKKSFNKAKKKTSNPTSSIKQADIIVWISEKVRGIGKEGYTYINGASIGNRNYSYINLSSLNSIDYQARILAHELLHSIGLNHDTEITTDGGEFLMDKSVYPNTMELPPLLSSTVFNYVQGYQPLIPRVRYRGVKELLVHDAFQSSYLAIMRSNVSKGECNKSVEWNMLGDSIMVNAKNGDQCSEGICINGICTGFNRLCLYNNMTPPPPFISKTCTLECLDNYGILRGVATYLNGVTVPTFLPDGYVCSLGEQVGKCVSGKCVKNMTQLVSEYSCLLAEIR